MKQIILILLGKLTKQIIKKHRPFIIGVTGTVGKTTATNFVYDFLRTLHGDRVYMSPYNYNGEFGIPMTILQTKSPYSNPFLWIWIFMKGIFVFFQKSYPRYLVLEYGIDRPGEMDFLVDIAPPDIAIILNISKNHVTSFPVFRDYIEEKMKLAKAAKQVIYNKDDKFIGVHIEKLSGKEIISYGIKNTDGDIFAQDIHARLEDLSFSLVKADESHEMHYPLIGEFQVYNILPVFALGMSLGMDIQSIRERITDIHPQKGRGSILKGIHESVIIDGSYNGGFNSISGGIEYLDGLGSEYDKILFIGDMRELGDDSKELHTEIAEKIIASSIQSVVLVGEEMKRFVYPLLLEAWGSVPNEPTEGIVPECTSDRVFSFLHSRLAGKKVRDIIMAAPDEVKTVIFVKGSQNSIYLEEGIKEFLYDLRDVEKLCRQSDYWMEIKNHFFESVIAEI
ncbi:MAG: UDP-N-acetylmuramoyl-tripeptide--D-alanyl-D-alanine ligase [Candidatus Gracilibacteria bacterium]|nr:UDP-N-acetylmuramoyl-tripeptide--D-alanyl-D-alanine ligase [Candidatus Gracilibacteria bacterium]